VKTNAGNEFMIKSRYSHISIPAQDSGESPQPPLELPFPADAVLISLVPHDEIQVPAMDLRQAIEQRRSLRSYSETGLTLEEFSYLLWVSQGVKKVSKRPATLRTVPSAGARHAFETYILVNRVESIHPGLYRFLAIENALLPLDLSADINPRITSACTGQSQVAESAATFLWVAVVERMYWRYVERGYRYLHLDAGHVCQNLALAAGQIGGGICPIAAFDDDALNGVLGLDGENLFVIYLASMGKKKLE
jgi:SagB-type dehydrogenase family enzyme